MKPFAIPMVIPLGHSAAAPFAGQIPGELAALVRGRADVLLQDPRPGQVESLKLDGTSLLEQKPKRKEPP